MQVDFQGIQMRFIYEGHQVKVTGMKCDPVTPGLSESMTAAAVMANPFQSFRV